MAATMKHKNQDGSTLTTHADSVQTYSLNERVQPYVKKLNRAERRKKKKLERQDG